MSGLQAFMAQNVAEVETIKRVISDRFMGDDGKPIPFEFKAISQEKDKELRKLSTKRNKRTHQGELDSESYMDRLVVASIDFPNLKDAELQKSWGVMGEIALFNKMLIPGERADALVATKEVNGYDKDMEELVEDAKN